MVRSLSQVEWNPCKTVRVSFAAHVCDGSGQRNVMTLKNVILTEIIAPYRIPVFMLSRAGAGLICT